MPPVHQVFADTLPVRHEAALINMEREIGAGSAAGIGFRGSLRHPDVH